MLYLHGASGTDYQYIHLNNDLGNGNDNRGSCTAGTAYVVKAFPDGGSAKLPGQSVTLSLPVGLAGPSDLAGRRVIVQRAVRSEPRHAARPGSDSRPRRPRQRPLKRGSRFSTNAVIPSC